MILVIIGGGSSLKEGIEKNLWERIKGKEIWSLNYAYKFMPYLPNRQLWVDTSFFKNVTNELQKLYEANVPLYCKENMMYQAYTMINQYPTTKIEKDTDNKIFIGQLGLVGMFALGLAVKEDFDTIYLLGYDFGSTSIEEKNTHFYQDKMKQYNVKSSGAGNPRVYLESNSSPKASIKDFNFYARFPIKIYNVSLNSHIPYFEKISYEIFFEQMKEQDGK